MFMPQRVQKKFYDGLEEGKVYGLKCPNCGEVAFPPVPTCSGCGSIDMEWIEIQQEAVVDNFETLTPHMVPAFTRPFYPYVIAHGRLVEGTPISMILLGITDENKEEMRSKLPLKAKVELIQYEHCKGVAWRVVEE